MPSVTTIVKKHWEVMTSNSKILERCFPQKSLVAYSRPKNLKDELIRARISTRKKSGRLKNGYGPVKRVVNVAGQGPYPFFISMSSCFFAD